MSHHTSDEGSTVRASLEALVPEPPVMTGYAATARQRARKRQSRRVLFMGGAVAAGAALTTLVAPAVVDVVRSSPSDTALVAGTDPETAEPTAEPTPEYVLSPPDCSVDKTGSSSLSQMNGPGKGAETAEEAAYDQADSLASPPFELVQTAGGSSVSAEWSLLRGDGTIQATILVYQDGDLGWKVSSVFVCAR